MSLLFVGLCLNVLVVGKQSSLLEDSLSISDYEIPGAWDTRTSFTFHGFNFAVGLRGDSRIRQTTPSSPVVFLPGAHFTDGRLYAVVKHRPVDRTIYTMNATVPRAWNNGDLGIETLYQRRTGGFSCAVDKSGSLTQLTFAHKRRSTKPMESFTSRKIFLQLVCDIPAKLCTCKATEGGKVYEITSNVKVGAVKLNRAHVAVHSLGPSDEDKVVTIEDITLGPVSGTLAPSRMPTPLPSKSPTHSPTRSPTKSPTRGWQCVAGFDTPVRLDANGDVQCASRDATNCLWATCPSLPSGNTRPLTCGAQHEKKWGYTGYTNPNHWCYKVRAILENWAKPTSSPSASPTKAPTTLPVDCAEFQKARNPKDRYKAMDVAGARVKDCKGGIHEHVANVGSQQCNGYGGSNLDRCLQDKFDWETCRYFDAGVVKYLKGCYCTRSSEYCSGKQGNARAESDAATVTTQASSTPGYVMLGGSILVVVVGAMLVLRSLRKAFPGQQYVTDERTHLLTSD